MNVDKIETGLTPEDYKHCIKLDPLRVAGLFVVIFCILGLFLYWFYSSMRANSNLKVAEATVLLDRAEEMSPEITPLTVELEEMAAETESDLDWLTGQLVADSFIVQHNNRLEELYRSERYYLPDEKLPADWRSDLPDKLKNWDQKGRAQRIEEVRAASAQLEEFVSRNRARQQRAEEIRSELQLDELEAVPWHFYFEHRKKVGRLLDEVDSALETTTINEPRLPGQLYDAATALITSLSRFTLQYRRLSAFTSAPSAYLQAELHLQDALRIDPKNPEALYQLGRVYKKIGLDEVSSEYYVRALKENPEFERGDEIVEMFQARLEEQPDDPRAYYDLGWTYYELGRDQEAEEKLLQVLNMEESQDTMVRVLARERLHYLRHGEPPYHKMAYH